MTLRSLGASTAGGTGTVTVYVSPDVPGGMVMGVVHQPGQVGGTLVLTSVDAK